MLSLSRCAVREESVLLVDVSCQVPTLRPEARCFDQFFQRLVFHPSHYNDLFTNSVFVWPTANAP